MHTNPILTSFCSILYYKDLSEYIHRYRVERRHLKKANKASKKEDNDIEFRMYKFGRRLSLLDKYEKPSEHSRVYNKTILNKWHLYIMMAKYPGLIQYRMANKKNKSNVKQENRLLKNVKSLKSKMPFLKKNENV